MGLEQKFCRDFEDFFAEIKFLREAIVKSRHRQADMTGVYNMAIEDISKRYHFNLDTVDHFYHTYDELLK